MTHRIYLKDTDPHFKSMSYSDAHTAMLSAGQWAKDNCKTFISYSVMEMSDVSSASCDWMGEYRFGDEKDLAWFKLKWS